MSFSLIALPEMLLNPDIRPMVDIPGFRINATSISSVASILSKIQIVLYY